MEVRSCDKCKKKIQHDDHLFCMPCYNDLKDELEEAQDDVDDKDREISILHGEIEDLENEYHVSILSPQHEEFIDAINLLEDKYSQLPIEIIEQIIKLSK